jgi:hypothetical protein
MPPRSPFGSAPLFHSVLSASPLRPAVPAGTSASAGPAPAPTAEPHLRASASVALRALCCAALARNWGADDMMLSVKQPPSIPVEPGNDFGRFLLQAPPPACPERATRNAHRTRGAKGTA